MAGIGFELRKVLGKGGIGGTVGAIVSGIFVVAGPWLISVLSMVVLQAAFSRIRFEGVLVFQATIVYSYAVSLSLSSGFQHHFTRIIADLSWEGRNGEATAWMLRFAGIVALASLAVSVPVASLMPLNISGDVLLYRISIVILFAAINVAWIVILFVSLLRGFMVISAVFALGMTVSIVGAVLLAGLRGVGGALYGYAVGVLVLDGAFIALALQRYPPRRPADGWAAFGTYTRRYRALILSGIGFYAGQWLDKFYFWAVRGSSVNGTPFRVYEAYDYPVYLAGLTIIPGLVYFTIITETQLFTDLKHFLFSLNSASWTKIQKAKMRVIHSLKRELRDQSLLQAAFSLAFAALVLTYGPPGFVTVELWLAMGAAFAQFTLLTILVFLYYFEQYDKALVTAGAYFVMNGVGGAVAYSLLPWLPAGAGHLLAGLVACAIGYAILRISVYRMDRIIFQRAVGV
ncbi:MAG: exopolysaccharide Pel transporter PelG [Spirochaetales bacterium]|nr:exopolysaccharide Pel transporter PelG [Spirochaetales bacterium]